MHNNADSLSRRPPKYCKRQDCPDCHSENHSCPLSPKELLQTDFSSRVAPLRTVNNESEAGDQQILLMVILSQTGYKHGHMKSYLTCNKVNMQSNESLH